jgi:hypothetical protein
MNPIFSTTTMNIKGREFVLAEVSRGTGHIGSFRYISTAYTATDYFYIDDEPVIKIANPNVTEPTSNKFITQISGAEKSSDLIKPRFDAACDSYFKYNQGLARSIASVLGLLNPGLYVVHESQMHPSDGEGNFFWKAYNYRKEIVGSSDKNSAIGDMNYSPCFLVPTQQPSSFRDKSDHDSRAPQKYFGLAYHISGMYSALLKGHHSATNALLHDSVFKCLVIEPVTDVMYDSKNTAKNKANNQKIIALSCPFVKIPLEMLPDNTLERFLITRRNVRPLAFHDIKPKLDKTMRPPNKRVFPNTVQDKAKQLPDCALIETSCGVDFLNEEQLGALLAGETKLNDELIITSNYYSSVIAAVNFLHVNDFNRFLTFSVDMLKNKERTVAHKFIAECLSSIMHPAIYEYFLSVYKEYELGLNKTDQDGELGETDDSDIIKATARKYVVTWDSYSKGKQEESDNYLLQRRRKAKSMQAIAEAKGIATLEAAVRNIGSMQKGAKT